MTCDAFHRPQPRLSIPLALADADRRLALGQHQFWCPSCGRWIWGEFAALRAPAPGLAISKRSSILR